MLCLLNKFERQLLLPLLPTFDNGKKNFGAEFKLIINIQDTDCKELRDQKKLNT